MISYVWIYLEKYGWFLTIGVTGFYFFYNSFIAPKIREYQQTQEFISRKKFDEDVHSREAEHLAAARKKQQSAHDIVAAELKEKEEDAKQRIMDELTKASENVSVFKYAVNTPPKKKTNRSPREIIDYYIFSKPIVVFSKTTCPYCRKAKSALATFRLSSEHFEYIELDKEDLPVEQIQSEFMKRYGSRTVPKVFIGGNFIGGGDETSELFQQGVLEDMVKAAIASFQK